MPGAVRGRGDADVSRANVIVVGSGAGAIRGGRHLRYPEKTPMSNLMLTLMDKLGVKIDRLGDSTGPINIDAEVSL